MRYTASQGIKPYNPAYLQMDVAVDKDCPFCIFISNNSARLSMPGEDVSDPTLIRHGPQSMSQESA